MGDGIRRIARAFYERAGEEEKKQADEFFRKLDLNGDRKISLTEFRKGVESGLSSEKVFNELDLNRDGRLDFNDVLTLFYYKKKKIAILRCAGCRILIFGPRYSCFQCLFNSANRRYALCCGCYGGGKFRHQHPLTSASTSNDVVREQALLVKLSQLMPKDPKSLTKKDMNELREIVRSHTQGSSPEVKKMVDNLFKSMGADKGIDVPKFSTLMIEQESAVDKFLKPRPDSDFATNYMKMQMKSILDQSNSLPPASSTTVAHSAASTSTPQTHYVSQRNRSRNSEGPSSTAIVRRPSHGSSSSSEIVRRPSHGRNPEPEGSSSNAIVRPSSIVKVASATFKIVDMALTIASLSSMCTIM